MKRNILMFTTVLCLLILQGCASAYQKKWQTPMEENNGAALDVHIKNGDHLTDRNEQGLTPLHTAARLGKVDVVKRLLAAGAPVHQQGKYVGTALHYAVWHNPEDRSDVIETLVSNGASLTSENGGYETPLAAASTNSNNVEALLKVGANPLAKVGYNKILISEYFIGHLKLAKNEGFSDWEDSLEKSLVLIDEYSAPFVSLQNCSDLADKYQPECLANHLKRFPNSSTVKTANNDLAAVNTRNIRTEQKKVKDRQRQKAEQQAKEKVERIRIAKIERAKKDKEQARLDRIASQACRLKSSQWFYLSKSCKNKLAHGQGEAINEDKNLKFIGQFKQGKRTLGELYVNNQLMYDGPIKNGRPHGTGTCIHEGEPEECKYYKGKRTDVLYKQRLEFIKQRELMAASEKRIQESLESSEQRMNDSLSQMREETLASGGQQGQGSTLGDYASDALKKKAADKAADFLFDQLF